MSEMMKAHEVIVRLVCLLDGNHFLSSFRDELR